MSGLRFDFGYGERKNINQINQNGPDEHVMANRFD